MNRHPWPEQFTEDRGITGICEIANKIGFEEVEKCAEMGESNAFRLRLTSLCDLIEEIQDVIYSYFVKFVALKFLTEFENNQRISPKRVFFSSGLCDNPAKFLPLFSLS